MMKLKLMKLIFPFHAKTKKKMHVYKPHQNLQQLLLTTPKVLVRDKHRHAYKFTNSPDRHYISFFKMYECKWILYKFCNISFVLPICLVFSSSSTYYSCLLFDVSFLSVFVTKCLCVCVYCNYCLMSFW